MQQKTQNHELHSGSKRLKSAIIKFHTVLEWLKIEFDFESFLNGVKLNYGGF